ncbi:MAG: hypothetical protein A3F42_00780 [Gammaproteobacteria bacterium RIFCSPHIGHO2_12_FULL_37_34]|nr:MAG: hypothetical protein A3F42_00780 [Gammaproteobacteria bacterium RIFCSPHIGHO2_12_FULL_37_34]
MGGNFDEKQKITSLKTENNYFLKNSCYYSNHLLDSPVKKLILLTIRIVNKFINIKTFLLLISLLWVFHPCLAANSLAANITPSLMHKKTVRLKKPEKQANHPHYHKKTKKDKSRKLLHTKKYKNQSANHTDFISSFKQHIIGFIDNTIASLRYSAYKLGGTHFDTSRGIYILDCSSYVDRILQTIYPKAYSHLISTTGSDKPTTHDYYNFFTRLSDKTRYYWDKIDTIEQLEPGDIIVFRHQNRSGDASNGHIMVVMDKPILNKNTNSYYLRVTDSAPSGHSKDTRPSHTSGIGIGTLMLKAHPKTYQPYAYAWKIGARWKYNVNFAMGRPRYIV